MLLLSAEEIITRVNECENSFSTGSRDRAATESFYTARDERRGGGRVTPELRGKFERSKLAARGRRAGRSSPFIPSVCRPRRRGRVDNVLNAIVVVVAVKQGTLQGKRNQYRVKHLPGGRRARARVTSIREVMPHGAHGRGVCPPSSLPVPLSSSPPSPVPRLSPRPLVDRSRLDRRHLFSVTRRRVLLVLSLFSFPFLFLFQPLAVVAFARISPPD